MMVSVNPGRTADSTSWTVHHWLILSCAFSCVLLAGRILVTGSTAYLFLPWNLFLAFVPYWITAGLGRTPVMANFPFVFYSRILLWLLFVPNSFYIITDLFHLTHITSAPQWFDLIMIFSFAWNGMLFGLISLRRVESWLTGWKGKQISLLAVILVLWLSALGIYIGRYLRFNSWDVITDPFSLFSGILDLALHPVQNGFAWGMTVCYAAFMTLVYFTIRKLRE